MKYLILLLLLAAVFGLCFLTDKGIAALKQRLSRRRAVRLPLRYPVLSVLLLLCTPFTAWYGISHHEIMFLIGTALILGVALYAIYTYRTTRIDYDDDTFTFRAGHRRETFRYRDILGQRVSISRHSVCLLLCLTESNVVLYNNMLGFARFLETAFAGWCRQKELDPQAQSWHDPADCRWFPDRPGPDDQP